MKQRRTAEVVFAGVLVVLAVGALLGLFVALLSKSSTTPADDSGTSAGYADNESVTRNGQKLVARTQQPERTIPPKPNVKFSLPPTPMKETASTKHPAISGVAGGDEKMEWTFRRDEAGRISQFRDPGGKETRWEYETFNGSPLRIRQATLRQRDGEIVYQFDERGRRTSMKDALGTVRYEWDSLGLLKSVQREGVSKIQYEYDAFGRLLRYRIGTAAEVSVTYDFLGRIERMGTPAGTISYEYRSGKTIRTLPNGVRTEWEREINGQLISITHVDSKNLIIGRFTYTYRPDGLISQVKEWFPSGEKTLSYQYDQVHRLIGCTESTGRKWQAEYDPMGNRINAGYAGEQPADCRHDWAGRLTSFGGFPCEHDASGNLHAATLNGRKVAFDFDRNNRLQSVNQDAVRFQYDGDGNLISRSAGNEKTTFLPDPTTDIWRPLAASGGPGATQSLYLWERRHPLGIIADRHATYFLEDHLGSVRCRVDESGKVVNRISYSPFGVADASNETASLSPGFAGLFWDGAASAYLTKARAYSSDLGRFLQTDSQHRVPSGSQKDLSLYAYAGNDPVNFTDINGADRESVTEFFDWTYPMGQFLNFIGGPVMHSFWIGANRSGAVFSDATDELGRFPLGPTTVTTTSRADEIAKWHDIQDWVNWHADKGTEVRVPVGYQQFEYYVSKGSDSQDHNMQALQYVLHPSEKIAISQKPATQSPVDLAVLERQYPPRGLSRERFNAREVGEETRDLGVTTAVAAFDMAWGQRPGLWANVSPAVGLALWSKDAKGLAETIRNNGSDPASTAQAFAFGLNTAGVLAGETLLGSVAGMAEPLASASIQLGMTVRANIMQNRAESLLNFGGAMISPPFTRPHEEMEMYGGRFDLSGPGYAASGGWSLLHSGNPLQNERPSSFLWTHADLENQRLQNGSRISGQIDNTETRTDTGGNVWNLFRPESEIVRRTSHERLRITSGGDTLSEQAVQRERSMQVVQKTTTPSGRKNDDSLTKYYPRPPASSGGPPPPPPPPQLASHPPPPPPPPPPSPVGGVYLGGAGRALDGMQQLRGLSLDPKTGNLILVAEDGGDVHLPPLRLDDVVTVFRSVYLHGEGPSVTINPDKRDPHGPTMDVVHGISTPDTYAGWILFQADRIMKGYNLGRDNVSNQEINSKVAGYADVLRSIFSAGDFGDGRNRDGNWERFWIVPTEVRRHRGATRELTVFDVPLKVKTQKMVMKNGSLEDDPKGKSSKGALAFTEWFTGHYDPISNECLLQPPPETGITAPVPVFAELRRIALITAIAEQARNQGIPLPDWMREYEVRKVTVDRTTPSLTESKYNARIFGGVNLSPADDVVKAIIGPSDLKSLPTASRAPAEREIALADSLAPELEKSARGKAPLLPFEVQAGGRQFHAVVLPGAGARALAPCRLSETDLSVPYEGGGEIALVRHFNSFFRTAGPWGRAWTMDLPQLEAVNVPVQRTDKGVTYQVIHDLHTPLGSIGGRFSKVAHVPSLAAELPVPDVPSEMLALASSGNPLVPSAKRKIIFKDGTNWHFDGQGRLVAVERHPFTVLYVWSRESRVIQIAGYYGDKVRATINLKYNEQGRMESAIAENSKGKKAISFEYNEGGALAGAASPTGGIHYEYAGDLVKSVSESAMNGSGTLEKTKTLRDFDYAPNGQLLSESGADGSRIRYAVEDTERGSRVAVSPAGRPNEAQTVSYDERYRPLERIRPDQTRTRYAYFPDGSAKAETVTPSGEFVRTSLSADGRRRVIESSDKTTQAEDYDETGRMVGLTINEKLAFRQKWNPDGTLKAVEYETHSVIAEYDGHGRMTKITQARPATNGRFVVLQETALDEAGRVASFTDGAGNVTRVGYADGERIGGLVTRKDGKDIGFTVKRQTGGRIEKIHSSWGDEDFRYDSNGNIERITATKGASSAETEYANGRLTGITQFDKGRIHVEYYDAGQQKGRLKSIQTPAITLGYEYGGNGLLAGVDCGGICRVAYGRTDRGGVETLTLMPGRDAAMARSESRPESKKDTGHGFSTGVCMQIGSLFSEFKSKPNMKDAFATPRRIGDLEMTSVHSSFTDLLAFRFTDGTKGGSIVKALPNDSNQRNLKQMRFTIAIAEYLIQKGANVARPMPIDAKNGDKIAVTPDAVLIRETVAPGVEMKELARKQNGLSARQERSYVDAVIKLARLGKDMPDWNPDKPSITTIPQMLTKLFARTKESRLHFQIFLRTEFYQKKFGAQGAEQGLAFDQKYTKFLGEYWQGEGKLHHTGLVHDANLGNCFLEDDNVTFIDVGSDFVGEIGNLLSIMSTQIRTDTQTYADYKAKMEMLLSRYEKAVGRPLSVEDRLEIIKHFSVQPYKIASSDSGWMLHQLRKACSMPESATEAELLDAMEKLENLAKIESFLRDKEVQRKFDTNMRDLQYSLMMLRENLPADTSAEKRKVLDDLIHEVIEVIRSGLRVVSLPVADGHQPSMVG